MSWQTYDIDFTAAKFDAGGGKAVNARLTLRHNGVVVHDNVELKNATGGGQKEAPTPGVFQLQDHGDPVVYRNIWALAKVAGCRVFGCRVPQTRCCQQPWVLRHPKPDHPITRHPAPRRFGPHTADADSGSSGQLCFG